MTDVPATSRATESLNIGMLNRLRAAGGDHVSLFDLGSDCEQVQLELDALETFGFSIERHPYRGAAYKGPAERLCPDQIEHELATRWIGRRIAVWNRVTSTNDLAARAGTSICNNGLVVLAEEQTAGRGRRGRSWTAPPRSSILMSVVLFPPAHLAPALSEAALGCGWLTALGAVATAEVVTAWTGRDSTIKWPNDVRVDGRKIAGILVERAPFPGRAAASSSGAPKAEPGCGAVIGIGLNSNLDCVDLSPEVARRATTLQIIRGGEPVDRSELTRDLIRRLDHWYDMGCSGGAGTLNAPLRARSEHLGQLVRVVTPTGDLIGRLVDLDLCSSLTLASDNGPYPESYLEGRSSPARIPLADILTLEAVGTSDAMLNGYS
jgi:BirA family biotin operon repressor/biotin-[acetyl-CoA-carboxylase] ligase